MQDPMSVGFKFGDLVPEWWNEAVKSDRIIECAERIGTEPDFALIVREGGCEPVFPGDIVSINDAGEITVD